MQRVSIFIACIFSSFILWAIYVANTGGTSIFMEFVDKIPYGDKVGHFCLFGGLTFIVNVASQFKSFSLGRFNLYYGTCLVVIFVIGEEFSQIYIPNRTFDLFDLMSDFVGIFIFTYLSYLCDKLATKNEQEQ